jgi:hypothetical protein
MPVSPDFMVFSLDNRTQTKCRGKRVAASLLLAIAVPMGYHARLENARHVA